MLRRVAVSLMRISGGFKSSIGNPKSYFEQVHKQQDLACEWCPQMCILMLVIWLRAAGQPVGYSESGLPFYAVWMAVVGRLMFHSKLWLPKSIKALASVSGATIAYLAYLMLILAAVGKL